MTDETLEPDLSKLLAPPAVVENPALRDAILRRTQCRLAFNRRMRRALQSAAVVAVFVGGVAVGMWLMPREREIVTVPTLVKEIEIVAVPVIVPVPGGSAEPAPQITKRTAQQLEIDAELADDAQTAANFYRQSGDAYLAEQDYANAARCYRLFLARGGDTALSPEPGDSWLLTSLKNAAFKEKIHATPTNG